MKKLLLISFLISFAYMSYSQNSNITGKWVLDKIDVTTTEGGQNSKKAYAKKQVYQTPTISIAELEFVSGNELSILFKGWSKAETAPYTISGNTLQWEHPTALHTFKLQQNNGYLEITSEGEYYIDGVKHPYKYIHYLTKKQ